MPTLRRRFDVARSIAPSVMHAGKFGLVDRHAVARGGPQLTPRPKDLLLAAAARADFSLVEYAYGLASESDDDRGRFDFDELLNVKLLLRKRFNRWRLTSHAFGRSKWPFTYRY